MTDNTELAHILDSFLFEYSTSKTSHEWAGITKRLEAAIKAWKDAAVEAARIDELKQLMMNDGFHFATNHATAKVVSERMAELLTTPESSQHPERTIDGIVYVTADGSNWTVKEQL